MPNIRITGLNPAGEICKSCAHLRLHYVSSGGGYYQSAYGHCKKLKGKIVHTTDKACRHWQKKG